MAVNTAYPPAPRLARIPSRYASNAATPPNMLPAPAAPSPNPNVSRYTSGPGLMAGYASRPIGGASPYGGQVGDILRGGADYLNPNGSASIQRGLEARALRSSNDAIHRGQTIAALSGLDPSAARATLGGIEGQNADRTANALNDAWLQGKLADQNWVRALFEGRLSAEDQQRLLQLQAQIAKDQQGGGFGDFLGSVLGKGLGALSGGVGLGYAGKLFPGLLNAGANT